MARWARCMSGGIGKVAARVIVRPEGRVDSPGAVTVRMLDLAIDAGVLFATESSATRLAPAFTLTANLRSEAGVRGPARKADGTRSDAGTAAIFLLEREKVGEGCETRCRIAYAARHVSSVRRPRCLVFWWGDEEAVFAGT